MNNAYHIKGFALFAQGRKAHSKPFEWMEMDGNVPIVFPLATTIDSLLCVEHIFIEIYRTYMKNTVDSLQSTKSSIFHQKQNIHNKFFL
jgi:hypothetical protein